MFTVYIKNNATGEVRTHIESDEDWFDGFDYLWTDGNYGCDCNRALYFARVNNEDEKEAWEQECGTTAFSVPYVELESGKRIIIDGGAS